MAAWSTSKCNIILFTNVIHALYFRPHLVPRFGKTFSNVLTYNLWLQCMSDNSVTQRLADSHNTPTAKTVTGPSSRHTIQYFKVI